MASNGEASTSDDLLAATLRLSKAVTSTAAAVMGGSSAPALLKSPHYQKAIYETLINPHRQKKHPTPTLRKRAPSEVFRSLSKDEVGYRAVTHIPDDLLNLIPEAPDTRFTLFQGFNALIPQVDEELDLFKALNMDELQYPKRLTQGERLEKSRSAIERRLANPLPSDVSAKKIRALRSTRNLGIYRRKIKRKLGHLEVKKDIASSEIAELDAKIRRLTEARDALLHKVAKLEKDEICLEGFVQEIDEKTAQLKGTTEESDDSFHSAEEEEEEEEEEEVVEGDAKMLEPKEKEKEPGVSSEGADKSTETDDSSPLMSQSIYKSLQKQPPRYHKTLQRVKPTLQRYYELGSVISQFQAHEQPLTAFDFDYPFGTLVLAALDGMVRMWDLLSLKCVSLLEGHKLPVTCLQMDDNVLVTGSTDTDLRLWDLSRVERYEEEEEEEEEEFENIKAESDEEGSVCVYTFEAHVGPILALHFDSQGLVSGLWDRTIRQWDMKTGHCQQTLDVLWASESVLLPVESTHNEGPFIRALQCYSAALASGTADGIVRLWDLRSGSVIRTLAGHTGPITCLQFDERLLVTGLEDGCIKIWDLRMGRIEHNLVYGTPICDLQFDQLQIVFANGGESLSIYERHSGQTRELRAENERAQMVRYKEGYLVGGYSNGIVKSWAF